ncbi:MAG: helix-turn-helix domain-containing protein [Endomicrobiia bacterium]
MEEIYKLVGRRIRQERLRLNITQERLAELTNLSVAFIGQIERGDNRASLVTIQKIAEALNVPISKLFTEIPAKKTEYKLSQQLEAILKDKTPSQKKFARDLLQFIFKKRI